MQQFTHPQGEVHNYQLVPLKSNPPDSPGATSTDVVYSVDFPAVATVQGNAGVSFQLVCQVNYLSPGTATITATGTDEAGNSFSTQFQIIVTPVAPSLTDHFSVAEIS